MQNILELWNKIGFFHGQINYEKMGNLEDGVFDKIVPIKK